MKPYSYSGGGHNNLHEVFKWASCGVRRRKTRRASATAASARRVTNHRARQAARKECREVQATGSRGGER